MIVKGDNKMTTAQDLLDMLRKEIPEHIKILIKQVMEDLTEEDRTFLIVALVLRLMGADIQRNMEEKAIVAVLERGMQRSRLQ